MEKKVISLLKRNHRTCEQNQFLVNYLSTFLKPVFTQFDIYSILSELNLSTMNAQMKIYDEGDKIKDYIILLEGSININKKSNNSEKGLTTIIHGPSIVGQYFYHRTNVREKRAIVGDQGANIIRIDKKIFDQTFSKQIKQYRFIQLYVENNFREVLSDPTTIIQDFLVFNYVLNTKIKVKDQLYVILKGQCLMCKKESKKKSNFSSLKNSSHENNLQNNHSELKQKRLLILGENQWIYEGQSSQHQYTVASEKLTFLRIPAKLIPDLRQKAQKIQEERIKRNQKSQQKQVTKKGKKYDTPSLIKKREKESQRILNSIDCSLNPGILKQKHLLDTKKFTSREKVKRGIDFQLIKENKPKKKQKIMTDPQPKGKDWSKYLKLPLIIEKTHRDNARQNIIITSIRN